MMGSWSEDLARATTTTRAAVCVCVSVCLCECAYNYYNHYIQKQPLSSKIAHTKSSYSGKELSQRHHATI